MRQFGHTGVGNSAAETSYKTKAVHYYAVGLYHRLAPNRTRLRVICKWMKIRGRGKAFPGKHVSSLQLVREALDGDVLDFQFGFHYRRHAFHRKSLDTCLFQGFT